MLRRNEFYLFISKMEDIDFLLSISRLGYVLANIFQIKEKTKRLGCKIRPLSIMNLIAYNRQRLSRAQNKLLCINLKITRPIKEFIKVFAKLIGDAVKEEKKYIN